MSWKKIVLASACTLALTVTDSRAAEGYPMSQGVHQWSTLNGKLLLVVGTYQDSTSFHHSYTFYFKEGKGEAWNQVVLKNRAGHPQFEWDSAVGADVTLADGVISPRGDAIYFIVADKRADKGYYEKGDITVTWYKLILADDQHPDDPGYQLSQTFTRSYPNSSSTVEAILGRELSLQPHK